MSNLTQIEKTTGNQTPKRVMNAYSVKFEQFTFYDADERGAMYFDQQFSVTVIAPSRGLARVFVMEVFNIWDFTHPMSIRLIDKNVPVEDKGANFPEEYGYSYEHDILGWHRTTLQEGE